MLTAWRRILRGPVGKREYYAFTRDVTSPIAAFVPRANSSIRLAARTDVPRLLSIVDSPYFQGARMDAAAIERRLAIGDVCFIAEHEGELAVVSWIRFDNATYGRSWLSVPMRDGEAYIGGTFTQPHHRNNGLATAVAVYRLRWMQEQGIKLAYSWGDTKNPPMLKVISRTEWQPVAKITQYYPRALRAPRLSVLRVTSDSDRLTDWCSPERMEFPRGFAIFTQARLDPIFGSTSARPISNRG